MKQWQSGIWTSAIQASSPVPGPAPCQEPRAKAPLSLALCCLPPGPGCRAQFPGTRGSHG